MKKIRVLLPFLLACVPLPALAVNLKWTIPAGDRLEMTRTAQVQFLVNEKAEKSYEERNIIDLTCHDRKNDASGVKGIFTVYQRDPGEEVFKQKEQYPAEFVIGSLGRFTVPKQYYMPNLRHVPTFPGRDVKAGDSWKADAELVLDVFSVPFRLTFPAEYRLVNLVKKGDSEIAEIKFGFIINMNLAGGKYPADFPSRIAGRDEGTLYWDTTNNHPVSMKEKYRIVFVFPSAGKSLETKEFQMIIETVMKMYKPVTQEQREDQKRALRKEMPLDIDVDTEKRGLVIRLGDVLFDFDSSRLRETSRNALDAIAGMLAKKYPDREIIVEGHTDSIGGTDYNLRLSKERAETVARYLKPRASIDKLSYRGFGAERPITGNDTRENRQKNRRVEIIIKLQ